MPRLATLADLRVMMRVLSLGYVCKILLETYSYLWTFSSHTRARTHKRAPTDMQVFISGVEWIFPE